MPSRSDGEPGGGQPRARVVVVVPTYNEAGTIETLIDGLHAAVEGLVVLVVDDASPDGTAELVRRAGERHGGGVVVLERPGKSGLGSAYRAGFEWVLAAGADVCVQMDADLSHDPAVVPALLAAVDGGADLVIGSRYVPGGAIRDWPRRRQWLSRGANAFVGGVLGLGVRDATAGFRAWRAGHLAAVEPGTVESEGYAFQVEMTRRSVDRGGSIVEVPITFTDRRVGESKLSPAIIWEAGWRVSRWGIADVVTGRRWARRRRRTGVRR